MTVLILGAKAMVAVLLLAAGGAKLADPAGFAAAVRLFVPPRAPSFVRAHAQAAAAAVIAAELACGAVSLCWPSAAWTNLAVLMLACGFTGVAAIGYARFRGRPCRCFGALTRRNFSVRSFVQSLVVLAAAIVATRPASHSAVAVGLTAHLLLLAAAGLLTIAASTAARSLATQEVAA
jgi:hypothetical protein